LPGDPTNVVMRFAPNPNGPLTLGHARGVVVNNHLARKYGGKLILRFDDTDPAIKRPLPEAYDWIPQDMTWLTAKPDKIIRASERIDLYYTYAEKLIEAGHAYVCMCEGGVFKGFKDHGKPCPHRDGSPEDNLSEWSAMLAGEYEEKQAVLRIKTDLANPDPALRDWVAFRIVKTPHPMVGDKYCVWPMLDFESAIEDHLQGLTHIIRGKDLQDSGKRQKYLYDYLDWEYPEVILWGRIKIDELGKFSTSEMSKKIMEGTLSGWDDPALPTIRALRRRGIKPEAIERMMLELGVSQNDVAVSMESLYGFNRPLIDDEANRYYFLEDAVELKIEGAVEKVMSKPIHPTHRDRGKRETPVHPIDGKLNVFVSKKDYDSLKEGTEYRLMNLYNVVYRGDGVADDQAGKNFKVPKLQWLTENIPCKILKPEGVIEGVCEPACSEINVGDIIQFERYAFVKLEEKTGVLTFIYTHS